MFFTLPWMLLGLVGLPTVAAIYWLRSRAQPRYVSSLFLWQDQLRPKQGGRLVERLQTPLTFFLELIAITALAIAAASPAFTYSRTARPLVLVLDDSYSMLAGGEDSSRERAVHKLVQEFGRTEYVARVVIAGSTPRLAGVSVSTSEQLQEMLKKEWVCGSPTAAMDAALSLAAEIGSSSARILAISDKAPGTQLGEGRVEWWSYGKSLPNLAVTAAARQPAENSSGGLIDRVLLEVSNFNPQPARSELILTGADLAAPRRVSVDLEAGGSTRLILNVANGTPELRVKLPDDSLQMDNQIVLVSPRTKPLRVQIAVQGDSNPNNDLKALLQRAFEACSQVMLVDSRPDLYVTDRPGQDAVAAYQLEILHGGELDSYEGPFILDRNHPMLEGLSLEAVIWSGPQTAMLTGIPIVATGNRGLMSESEDLQGRRRIQMAFDPSLSNLTETPDWPILITNLVRNGLAQFPGPRETNVRLGQPLPVTFAPQERPDIPAVVTLPDGTSQNMNLRENRLEVLPETIGMYRVKAGEIEYSFGCNALNADESNLASCETGRWGNWNESTEFQDRRVELSWALILIALGCLAARFVLLSRLGVGGT